MPLDERDVAALLHLVRQGLWWADTAEMAVEQWGWDVARARAAKQALNHHIKPLSGEVEPSGELLLQQHPWETIEAAVLDQAPETEDPVAPQDPLPNDPVHPTDEISDFASRRQILRELVTRGEKYSRPFTRGKFATFSLIGTEDWQDYAALVLQVVQIDTLLNIEQKLDSLLAAVDTRAESKDESLPPNENSAE